MKWQVQVTLRKGTQAPYQFIQSPEMAFEVDATVPSKARRAARERFNASSLRVSKSPLKCISCSVVSGSKTSTISLTCAMVTDLDEQAALARKVMGAQVGTVPPISRHSVQHGRRRKR
jgi:hypothetical protein